MAAGCLYEDPCNCFFPSLSQSPLCSSILWVSISSLLQSFLVQLYNYLLPSSITPSSYNPSLFRFSYWILHLRSRWPVLTWSLILTLLHKGQTRPETPLFRLVLKRYCPSCKKNQIISVKLYHAHSVVRLGPGIDSLWRETGLCRSRLWTNLL